MNSSNTIRKAGKKKGYSFLKISRADQLNFGAIHLRCLHPQKGWEAEDTNSGSLVLYLTYDKFTMLFTGDLNGEQESLLEPDRGDELHQNSVDLLCLFLRRNILFSSQPFV